MKKIFTILCLLVAGNLFSQFDDTTLYTKYPGIYGLQYPRMMLTKVLRPPTDTIYSKTGLAIKNGVFYYGNGTYWQSVTAAGSVTTFSAGNLSPLFTTSVSNATSTPALSFTLANAGALTVFGNNTGSSAAPSFFNISALGFITNVSSNNGITENVANNFQLGGTLIQTTKFTMGGNTVEYEGGNVFMDDGRLMFNKGGDVASTGNLTLGAGTNGNAYNVTGDVQINAMTSTNWQEGSLVWLHFADTLTIKNNTTGGAGTSPFMLSGGGDFTTDSTTVLSLLYINGKWNEVSRKQLQGSFIENRTTVQSTSNFFISGNGKTSITGGFSSPGAGSGSEKFGFNSSSPGANSLAVGNGAIAAGQYNTVVGAGSVAAPFNSNTIIGQGSSNNGSGATFVGASINSSSGNHATWIGSSITGSGGSTAVGFSISMGSTNNVAIGEATNNQFLYSQVYGFGATATATNQLVFGGSNVLFEGINDAYYGRGVTSAGANNFKMQPTGASGADMAGNTFTIAGSKATGNATPGVIVFQTSTIGSTGSTLQTLNNRIQINGSGILAYNGVMPTSGSGGTDSVVMRNSSNGQFYLGVGGGGGSGNVSKVGTPVNNQIGVWTGDGTIEGDANLTFASATLSIGVAGSATGIITMSGATSGVITIQPASAAGTYTLTLPTTDGDADQVLTSNGSGVLSWTTVATGSALWNSIASPTGDQALTFDAGESSTWTNSNTTEDLFTVNSSTVTTSSFFSYNRTSTALAAGNNIMELISSGVNGSSAITATGLNISITNSGTTSVNKGLVVDVSGAATNYSALFTGRVGIGTATPSTNFETRTATYTDGPTFTSTDPIGSFLFLNATTGASWGLASHGSTFGTNNLAFFYNTGGATTALLTPAGHFINGSSFSTDLAMLSTKPSGTTIDGISVKGPASYTGNYLEFTSNAGSDGDILKVDASGVITASNLAGTGSRAVLADASGVLSAPVSDRSVKKNIQSLDYGLNTIMQLNPVSFEYKDGWKNYGQGKQIGFIAQDIQQVLPNSVFRTPSTGKLGYNEIDLVPVLVKAVQEQQEEINYLKKEIKKLKHK